jgi:hypothetical protein
MKVTYRIPTKEQYAYIELVEDILPGVTPFEPTEIRARYQELTDMFQKDPGPGLGMKQFANILHEYCTTGGIVNGGEYEFSEHESLLLNELKKLMRKDKGVVRERESITNLPPQ